MRAKSVYELVYPDSVELFAESESGGFDFDSSFDAEKGRSAAAERASQLLGADRPAVELFLPEEPFRRSVYEAAALRSSRRRLFRRSVEGTPPPSAGLSGFLLRYPGLRTAFHAGALAEAGRIIDHSHKLSPFFSLLAWRFQETAFLSFALYWMNAFDGGKEATLTRLLTGGPEGRGEERRESGLREGADRRSPYAAAFSFAKESIKSRDLASFKTDAARALGEHLVDRQKPLVLPVVGAGFRPTLGTLSNLLRDASAEARRRALVEGLSGAEERIASYAETLGLKFAPEPYNPHDPQAIAVLVQTDSGGSLERAGYLKREVAAALAPLVSEGATLVGRFARIYEDGGAEVELRIDRG